MGTAPYREFQDLLSRGDCKGAIALAERESLQSRNRNGFWPTQLARAFQQDRQYARAREAAERALEEAPQNAYALLARADALHAEKRFRDALADYEEVLGLDESRTRGRAVQGALRCLAALEAWQRIRDKLPEWLSGPAALEWQARALAGLGRRDDALAACHAWLTDQPDHPPALWLLTELEIERDGLEAVLGRMSRLARIPSRPDIYREIAASLCRRAGRTDDALDQYAKLAAKRPHPRVTRKQAFTLAKSGRETEAIPLMEELLRLDPADHYVHAAYGAACGRADELDRAEAFYRELIAAHPEHKPLHGRLRKIRNRAKEAR